MGGATVPALRDAVEQCGVVQFLRDRIAQPTTDAEFDRLHRDWSKSIIERLSARGLREVSYGRAAKLIAIYLKAMVILCSDAGADFVRVIHPPIDSLLLHKMSKDHEICSPRRHRWRSVRWTQLDESAYFELVSELREVLREGEPFWMLERFWNVDK